MVSNAEDLSKGHKIKYGLQEGGSTEEFFKVNISFNSFCIHVYLVTHIFVPRIQTSTHHIYKKMWHAMEHFKPSVFLKDNDEGIEHVRRENPGFAFFMESSTIAYETHEHCDLMALGEKLDEKAYGLGMPLSMFQFCVSMFDSFWF